VTVAVLDASVVGTWVLPRQGTLAAEQLLLLRRDYVFMAPALLELDVRSLLLKAERQGFPPALSDATLFQLTLLPVEVRPWLSPEDMDEAKRLARSEGLSIYDAVYLRLALELGTVLASRDRDLLAAAIRRGLTIIDVNDRT
jgi:predicted nucleic acid-binding protein